MAIRAGARGFVNKLDPPEDLIQAIIAVRNKKTFVSHRLVKEPMSLSAIFGTVDEVPGISAAETQLSNREIEVTKLLAQGKTNTEVATELHISIRTAEAHRTHVMRKMKFTNPADASGSPSAISGSSLEQKTRRIRMKRHRCGRNSSGGSNGGRYRRLGGSRTGSPDWAR